ncbi:MAG: hypothetical protein IT381_28185 [Deltaproteobacteria bacterium]|nr:hypothetical protein [Deltaproteobacteria bacterium]
MDQTLQIVFGILTVGSGIATTIWGYKAVAKTVTSLKKEVFAELETMRSEMHTALEGKIDHVTYSAKVKELHDKNNELERRVAVQENEAKNLRDMVEYLKLKKHDA